MASLVCLYFILHDLVDLMEIYELFESDSRASMICPLLHKPTTSVICCIDWVLRCEIILPVLDGMAVVLQFKTCTYSIMPIKDIKLIA
jgi:hypothetical protein